MKDPQETFYSKVYIVAFLCTAIVVTLGYLILTGGTRKLKKISRSQPQVIVTTPNAVPTSTPIPTFIPSVTDLPLVNKNHPLDSTYVPEGLVQVNVNSLKEERLLPEAATSLETMFQAASTDGITLQLISAYRTYEEEESLYQYYSETYGQAYANQIDDQPGRSEHQLGLAVDLDQDGASNCSLNACFGYTDVGEWLEENSYKYGWILRYPLNKEEITGILYSPWAFRYVGIQAATEMRDNNLTLEEYLGQ